MALVVSLTDFFLNSGLSHLGEKILCFLDSESYKACLFVCKMFFDFTKRRKIFLLKDMKEIRNYHILKPSLKNWGDEMDWKSFFDWCEKKAPVLDVQMTVDFLKTFTSIVVGDKTQSNDPIMFALHRDDRKFLKILFKTSLEFNDPYSIYGCNLAGKTCRLGSYKMVQQFIEIRKERNIKNILTSVIHEGCCNSDNNVAALLFKEAGSLGIETCLQDKKGRNTLHLLAYHGHHELLKQLILTQEAFNEKLNAKDNEGNTILHISCQGEDINTLKFLLQQPTIDANVTNNWGNTPLHEACCYLNVDAVAFITQNRSQQIDLTMRNNTYSSPADILKEFYPYRNQSIREKVTNIKKIFAALNLLDADYSTDDSDSEY